MSRPEWFDGIDPDDADKGTGSSGPSDSGRPPRPGGPRAGGAGLGGRVRPGGVGTPPKRGPLGTTLAIIAALVIVALLISGILTDLWWFDSVGFRDVFVTQLGTRVLLFIAAFIVTAGAVAASLITAYRTRPLRIAPSPSAQVLDQYRQVLDPLRRLATVVIPAVLGLLAGAAAMGAWRTFLLWRNAVPFGTKDPQFHLDVGFFVFTLPWLHFLVSFFTVVLLLALIAAAFTHYVYGGLQLPGRGTTTRAAFVQIATLASLLALVRAASYWLGRYSLTTHESKLITGITYTDANAVLPIKAILAVATVMCAGFFIASIWTRSWRLPLIGVGLLTVLSVVAGGIYPAAVQSLKVRPSEKSLEAKYIQRNIDATRAAFAIDGIEKTPYAATTDAEPGQLRADAETIPGIRLVDPNVVSPTFRQFEGLRQYYAFPDILDVDRYTVDGKKSDSIVAVRELNIDGVPENQRNWLNDHTVYTHGFGFIGAYGNRRTSEGDPQFFSNGFSTKGPAGIEYDPRIYFGEQSPTYSIVGAPKGAKPLEFDYPDDKGEGGQANNTFDGNGGVKIGSFIRKVAYAIKYREPKFLLSDAVNSQSRILDHRMPRERVERVAPWLTVDGNAYPAVVDGRVKWIVDGYTTSARYPNSRLTDLSDATSDSVSATSRVVVTGAGQVNYIRNSVKATVDAADGSVKLYAWDTTDPILKAWSHAFPDSVSPLSEMSSQLMSHVRYPQDLFKVQRQLLASYHVTDANSFYGGGDFWRVPKDPTHANANQDQPVYYQSLAMPDQKAPAFSLTTTFIPSGTGREILRGFLAVDADAGSTAGKPAGTYGKMRLLELPRNSAVDGPGQVQNQIEVSTARSQSPSEPLNLSQFIAQNRQSGKQLTYGNLLTLPVGEGLLYVQPMYVQASREGGSFPQNKATVAVFGKKIAWGETLDQALDGLFGGNSGATAGDSGTVPDDTTPPPGDGTSTPAPSAQLAEVIRDIEAANAAGQAALKKGDFAAYGVAQKDLQDAIARAAALSPQLTATPKPTGSATPTPTPTPSATP